MKQVYFLLCLIVSLFTNAQEKLGITNSNYSSTNSIFLNPVSSVDSKVYMQINLAGLNAYAFTNAAYLPKFNFLQLRSGAIPQPTTSTIRLKHFAYVNASVEGPAFVISKRNFGAGFFIRARSVVDVRRVPYQLINMLVSQTTDPAAPKQDNINLKNVKASNMTWLEYGGNFGYMIKKQRKEIITIAGNLRYLTGINIFYANLTQVKGFYNDSVVKVDNVQGKLRFNEPAFNTGKGWGLDAGISYKKMLESIDSYYPHSKQSNCGSIDYKYKIAASLRDVGYINFKKKTSRAEVNASGYYRVQIDTNYKEILETNFNTSMLYNKSILATLPTNLSIQADWNFENHVYLNVSLVKNLVPVRFIGVQSQDLISIAPRIEFKQVEVALPLTLQRFIYPQLGIAARYRSFVLGFDNLFPLIYKKNTYGLNVYFSLGISLFKNPACRVKKQQVASCPPDIFSRTFKKKQSRKKNSGKSKKFRWFFKRK